jgi:hypothetical protein
MANEVEKLRKETPAPSPTERRAWWWRIYLAGGIGGSILFVLMTSRFESPFATLFRALILPFLVTPLLPVGLAFCFGGNLDGIVGSSGPGLTLLEFFTVPLAYCLYTLHLRLTLQAGTRRAFFLLMLSLILLVTASLVGCDKLVSRPIGMQ